MILHCCRVDGCSDGLGFSVILQKYFERNQWARLLKTRSKQIRRAIHNRSPGEMTSIHAGPKHSEQNLILIFCYQNGCWQNHVLIFNRKNYSISICSMPQFHFSHSRFQLFRFGQLGFALLAVSVYSPKVLFTYHPSNAQGTHQVIFAWNEKTNKQQASLEDHGNVKSSHTTRWRTMTTSLKTYKICLKY